jgi:hypothetical protein
MVFADDTLRDGELAGDVAADGYGAIPGRIREMREQRVRERHGLDFLGEDSDPAEEQDDSLRQRPSPQPSPGVPGEWEERSSESKIPAEIPGDFGQETQIGREFDPAGQADQTERDALQMELDRGSQMSDSPVTGELARNLADAARKFDDAATKLDKVFSNAKTSTLLKD